jgi:hypothetical protein
MPGYGILPEHEGTGLLSWRDVEPRLAQSHDYWLATTWPDGRPHIMPVWGVWHDSALWFASSRRSRKIANLSHDPRCVATSDDAQDPVIIEGAAEVVTDEGLIARFLELLNAKYQVSYPLDFLNPAVNATVCMRPHTGFALLQSDFLGSPTRWRFASRHQPPPARS